jgi:hypothetical protein
MTNAWAGFPDQPGLHQECGCFELAAEFELPAPERQCPAAEAPGDAYARRQSASAAAKARTSAAVDDVFRAITRAERRYHDLADEEQQLARNIAAARAGAASSK